MRFLKAFTRPRVLLSAAALICAVAALLFFLMTPRATAGDEPFPAGVTGITPPLKGESLETVRGRIGSMMQKVQTVKAEIEISKQNKDSRKVRSGPMELARGRGARVALTRKGKTEEYFALQDYIWSYDHHDKEAQFIPTSMPVLREFVKAAMGLDLLLAMDPDTMKYVGSSDVDGEPCWVIDGKSPSGLRAVGVAVVQMRVWVAKKDGVPRRVSIPGEKDLQVMIRNVELNAEIPQERLTWQTPKGVKVKNVFGF